MRTRHFLLFALVVPLALAGCSRKTTEGVPPPDAHAFDSAPPEKKAVWEKAVEAAKTNDFVTAYRLFYTLSREPLPADQQNAASNAFVNLSQRLTAAAEKGDTAALDALKEVRRNPMNR